MKKKNKILFALSGAIFLLISVLSSCSFFNKPMLDELKKYTENVLFMKYELNVPTQNDMDGIPCVTSSQEVEVQYYLTNPQMYRFAENAIQKNIASKNANHLALIETQQIDSNLVTMRLPVEYLTQVDGVDFGIIDPQITLNEVMSGRPFGPFHVALRCNTPPMAVRNLTVLRTNENTNSKYILCFNMPDFSGIHKDVKTLTISGSHMTTKEFNLEIDAANLDSNTTGIPTDSSFLASYDDSWVSGADNPNIITMEFDQYSQRAVYFDTGVNLGQNVTFTVTITDKAGLSSTSEVSTSARKLKEVSASPLPDGNSEILVDTDENTGWGILTINAPESGCTVYYIVREDGSDTEYLQGSGKDIATVKLPGGIWEVEAWANKNGCLDSDPKTFTVKVVDKNMLTAYVIGEGSTLKSTAVDTTTSGYEGVMGSKARPFVDINKALEKIQEMNGDLYSGMPFTIMVDGTITATDGDFNNDDGSAKDSFITVPGGIDLTIQGYNSSGDTIYAARNGNNLGRVIKIDQSSSVTLKNVTITGGHTDDDGGGVYVDMFASLILESGAMIKENTAQNGGGVCTSNGYLEMNDGAIITRNTATENGGGIYSNNTIGNGDKSCDRILGGEITQNSAQEGGGVYKTASGWLDIKNATIINNIGGGVHLEYNGSYTMPVRFSGKITVSGNTKNNQTQNVFLKDNTTITVQGSLAGSRIGVTVETPPENAASPVVFTSGYSSYNSASPATIFTSDDPNYGVALKDGEAAISIGGGSISGMVTSVEITAEPNTVQQGGTITFTAKALDADEVELTNKTPDPWDVTVYHNGTDVTPSSSGTGNGSTYNFTIPNDWADGIYHFNFAVEYDGVEYSAVEQITVKSQT